jgi:acyl-CoA hydrolase
VPDPVVNMSRPTPIARELEDKRVPASVVLDHLPPDADVIVGLGNGAPQTVLDAIEAGGGRFEAIRLHQMLPLVHRRYMSGEVPNVRHVSWFLSGADREAFASGQCDLVPADFSDVPHLMLTDTWHDLAVVSVSPPGPHGYFSLGTHADYTAALIGKVPLFLEANARMPRTFGANQIHVSQCVGWCEADYPLVELDQGEATPTDQRIADFVVERIPDGATLQAGIGRTPNAILHKLGDHRHLGVHTELLGDGMVDLVEAGVVTGARKATHPNKIVTTNALGTRRIYDFVRDNTGVSFHPVDVTNDPRLIGREPHMVSINSAIAVDFLGQVASESIGTKYWSSSGGQADFARGALYSEHGQSFIVLHATAGRGEHTVSRICDTLPTGAAVTTFKNMVDRVVTEHGVAELRGASIAERAKRLIAIAAPEYRDELTRAARERNLF